MRIALVIERFEPRGGGMEAVAWSVAHGLAAAGDEVHVVARTAEETPAVTLRRVRVAHRWQPLRVRAFSRAAAEATANTDFDLVHAFSRTRTQDLYRAGGGSHADYLEQMHGRVGRTLRRASPRHRVLLRIEREVFGDARQWIQCGSQLVRDQIARRYGVPSERLHVLRNGVDLERFHPPPSRAERERPSWLFAGSGWRRKGLAGALAATAASRGTLRVAGRDDPGPWRRQASALGIADRVEFLGAARDMASLYREADALLLPTRYDAFANVCLEALASGLPVVTTRANGSAEILEDAGLVVDDADDVASLAAALERLSDATLRQHMAERARTVAEQHGWEHHVEALRALYRRCAARTPAP